MYTILVLLLWVSAVWAQPVITPPPGGGGGGSGDITGVFDCLDGQCSSLNPAEGEKIDFSAIDPTSGNDGLALPQATSCVGLTGEGFVCWESDADLLWIGTGAGAISASGDITSVFQCASGACTSITLADGQLLNMSSVNPNTQTEGLILPQATSCASAIASGQLCWDSDDDMLFIGNGVSSASVSGNITAVFDCTSGACASVALADGDLIDMSAVNPNTGTEGLIWPQSTSCTQTAEGQVCWNTSTDRPFWGTGAGTFEAGDITSVYNCTSGACTNIAPADGSFLNMSAINTSSATEGLRIPQSTSCAAGTAAGQLCFDTDDNKISIGNGSTQKLIGITDIFNCNNGDCNSVTLADGDLLSMASVVPNTTTEGFILPQSTSCTSATAEGQVCWDSDDERLHVGDGTATQAFSIGDITSVFDCLTGDCSSFIGGTTAKIDFSSVDVDDTSNGLILPSPNDCTTATLEGQICWDADNDVLSVGDGVTSTVITGGGGSGDITDVFNCASGDCASVTLADGDLLSMASVNPTTTSEGFISPQGTDCSSATAEGQHCWESDADFLWLGDGAAAVKVGPLSLDEVVTVGRSITTANSRANALIIGDGTDGMLHYTGASGPTQECVLDIGGTEDACDYSVNIATGSDYILNLAGTPELTISSAGAVTLGSAMEETHRLMIPAGMLAVDGTECTRNLDQTLDSEVFPVTVTCTDDDAATIKFDFPAPEAWDEATLTIDMHLFQSDGTPDGNYNIDWSGYCAGHNDPYGGNTFTAEDANGAMDFAASAVATNDLIKASTVGQVPIGACSEGDMVRIRGQVDAAGTTALTPEDLHILWVVAKIAYNTWSNQ